MTNIVCQALKFAFHPMSERFVTSQNIARQTFFAWQAQAQNGFELFRKHCQAKLLDKQCFATWLSGKAVEQISNV